MHRLFLDANIVLDFFLRREPDFDAARTLLHLGETDRAVLGMSAAAVPFAYFHLNKQRLEFGDPKDRLRRFVPYVTLVTVDADVVRRSLISSIRDVEDATQYELAADFSADFLITRDKAGFKGKPIPQISPHDYLSRVFRP